MSEQQTLYKVVLRYDALAARDLAVGLCSTVAAVLEFTTDLNRDEIDERVRQVGDWLTRNDRVGFYINWYDQSDHVNGVGQIVIVLNDRDTALMLKLALA